MPEQKTFPNLKSVLEYLHKSGRKVSQSKLYNDFNAGLLRRQPDMNFKQRDVDRYASTLALVSMPQAKTDNVVDLAVEKLRVEIGKIDEQRRTIVLDREIKTGKYVRRDEVALELASRAAAFSLSLRSMFRLNVADYIRMTGGDVSKAEELASEFERNLDMALNEFSKPMEFTTEFISESSPPEEKESDDDNQS